MVNFEGYPGFGFLFPGLGIFKISRLLFFFELNFFFNVEVVKN